MGWLKRLLTCACVCGSFFVCGCALFQWDETEVAVALVTPEEKEDFAAILDLFESYARAMTTKDVDCFKQVYSEQHSLHYKEEIASFRYLITQCDMEMKVRSVVPYQLSETSACVEVILDTHYLYVPEAKKEQMKDFRLTTRFQLLKVEGRWVIEHNIKKYMQKEWLASTVPSLD
ncbi:MAG: hypothetical protein Q4C03_03795 [bacterium]|nr:hypothetical protein [bacterium]